MSPYAKSQQKKQLFFAAENNDVEAIRQLIEQGADPLDAWSWDADGARVSAGVSGYSIGDKETALTRAAIAGAADAVKALLPLSDAKAQSAFGLDALMAAALADSAECARILAPVSDLSAVDSDEACALRIAARNGHTAFVRAVLSLPGLDPKIWEPQGPAASAFAKAVEESQFECARLIGRGLSEQTITEWVIDKLSCGQPQSLEMLAELVPEEFVEEAIGECRLWSRPKKTPKLSTRAAQIEIRETVRDADAAAGTAAASRRPKRC